MSRSDKLLERLKTKPKDFTYEELRRLMRNLDCDENLAGKISGSRVAFVHRPTKMMLRLHRPHPGNELKAYQVDDTLEFLELMKMITQGVMIKKCENCKRYFVPVGRSDIEYCTRALSDQPDKTCQSIGALKKHQQKVQKNPIRKEYSRAYKRNHSRVGAGSMSQSEFLSWSDEAREKRDLCLTGKIDSFTFKEWLNKDRRYKKRS